MYINNKLAKLTKADKCEINIHKGDYIWIIPGGTLAKNFKNEFININLIKP